ncbi:flagellar hook-length control protein FliK [Tabrizicola sp. YIM 78059]|uniref:flagellar hook-length control protein FliK n=1 Tax=Tabrizicola sp. YIM 78059 TaxID=2529861 RepID=UPI00145B2228|nr:flagellar hook-length control protein FliK [Tabrizicola sp. YIM 78059]
MDGLTFVAGSPGRAAAAGLAPVIVPDHPEKQRPTDSTAGADLLAAEQAFRRPVPASALAPMAGPSGGLLPDPAALPLLAHTLPHASTGAMAHAPALPNIGASIGQLALAIVDPGRHAKDKVTEIRLSPDELGSVRVTLQTDAADPDRIAVMLSFDRPDTLDLFRRHAEQLTEALRLAGFPRAEIGFGQHGADQWQSGTPGSGREEPRRYGGASDAMPADAAVKPGVLRQSATPASSLDLRL